MDIPEDMLAKPAWANKESAEAVPYDGIATFDHELIADDPEAPSRGIITRYKEIARLHAHGRTNNEICARLGYTASRLSIILKDPFVQTEITRWRDLFFSGDSVETMKNAARDGAQRLHEIILSPDSKDESVIRAASFAIEQANGKAKQTVETTTHVNIVTVLKEMRAAGELTDVTPRAIQSGPVAPIEQPDELDTWISANLG